MKVTRNKKPDNKKFREITIGQAFQQDHCGIYVYIKVASFVPFTTDWCDIDEADDDYCNAICLNDGSFAFFDDHENVFPIECEIAIK